MKTVSKGAIFTVTVSVRDSILETMKHMPHIVEAAMGEAAEYWHSKILPEHFKKEAHGRYGYAQRSRNYLKAKRGKPDLVNSGSLSFDLKNNADKKVQNSKIELRMWARVLNLIPRMQENNLDAYVTHKGRNKKVSTYPNLKREIKAITDDEREAVAQVIVSKLERAFGDDDTESFGD